MAKGCPKACSRLFAAAAFLVIGIVQVVTGMILLQSKYAYLLSGPNFWTAISNIVVGSLLGVSATLWKTINKARHAAKRNLLAALTCSSMILNGTTAAILLLGESNNLLSIHLESSAVQSPAVTALEFLAYAYTVSVCSPIACIVISLTLLTSMCFQTKVTTKRSLDFKTIANTNTDHKYSWSYISKLPQPDSQILKKALSETSLQSDSDTSCSSSVTPEYLNSHRSFNDSKLYELENSSCPIRSDSHNHDDQNATSEDRNRSRSGRVCFADESTLAKEIIDNDILVEKYDLHARMNPLSYGKQKYTKMPKAGFVEYPSGNFIERTESLLRGNDTISPEHAAGSSDFPPYNKRFLDSSQTEFVDSPPDCRCTNLSPQTMDSIITDFQPRNHEKLQRTSTCESHLSSEHIEVLGTSKTPLAAEFTARETRSKLEVRFSDPKEDSNVSLDSAVDHIGARVKYEVTSDENKTCRPKLSSKLIKVKSPVISNEQLAVLDQALLLTNRKQPDSKQDKIYHNYVDYSNQRGLSTFRNKKKSEEIDDAFARKNDVDSPVISVPELVIQEASDAAQPCTSTHTSGYMSIPDEESSDSSDVEKSSEAMRNCNLAIEQPIQKEISSSCSRKGVGRISRKVKNSKSVQRHSPNNGFQDVLQQLVKENPLVSGISQASLNI